MESKEHKSLTVITVVRNSSLLIERTIKSVLLKPRALVEYIIIDGDSDDGTKTIIESYQDAIDQYLSESDLGIYDAMNKGINLATTDWILFLNAGDTFDPSFEISALDFKHPVGIEVLAFSYRIEDQENIYSPSLDFPFGMPSSHQALIVRAKVAKTNLFNLQYKVAADYDFFLSRVTRSDCPVRLYTELLSVVQPDGYSQKNIHIMRQDYFKIVLTRLGVFRAVQYYVWSRPLLYLWVTLLVPRAIIRRFRSN
jgi:glycosyltransferase involved in cell wall biosynthesis